MTKELLNIVSIISDLDSCLTYLELLLRRGARTTFNISPVDILSKIEPYQKHRFDKNMSSHVSTSFTKTFVFNNNKNSFSIAKYDPLVFQCYMQKFRYEFLIVTHRCRKDTCGELKL